MELLQGCLLPADSLAAAGVAYHLADIWVDELDVVADSAGKIPLDAAVGLLRPFLEALSKSPNQTLITRIRYACVKVGGPAARKEGGRGQAAWYRSQRLAMVGLPRPEPF